MLARLCSRKELSLDQVELCNLNHYACQGADALWQALDELGALEKATVRSVGSNRCSDGFRRERLIGIHGLDSTQMPLHRM